MVPEAVVQRQLQTRAQSASRGFPSNTQNPFYHSRYGVDDLARAPQRARAQELPSQLCEPRAEPRMAMCLSKLVLQPLEPVGHRRIWIHLGFTVLTSGKLSPKADAIPLELSRGGRCIPPLPHSRNPIPRSDQACETLGTLQKTSLKAPHSTCRFLLWNLLGT